jgi:DNA-binding transcriptional MerR regulator
MTSKIQNTFRYLAARKIKQIIETNTHKTLYKRNQYNLNQIKTLLEQSNLTTEKADKCRTMVIVHKDTPKQKIDTLIQENQIKTFDNNNILINNQHKMTTLDMKHLNVNLPIQNIIDITKFCLNKTTIKL